MLNISELGNKMRNGTGFWDRLVASKDRAYGRSALTTYWSNREMRNIPAAQALRLMKAQIDELGREYKGGFECTKYRNPSKA